MEKKEIRILVGKNIRKRIKQKSAISNYIATFMRG